MSAVANQLTVAQYELELRRDIGSYYLDPLGFVLYAFPWGKPGTALSNKKGPRDWQRDVLDELGKKLRAAPVVNRETMVTEVLARMAVSSGHGIGKSALVAFIILWAMSTREDTRGTVTANTATQLETKTWPELTKWHGMLICGHWFRCAKTFICSTDQKHEGNWRIDAVPWSEARPEASAGLHNEGKRLLLVFDEASAIPDKIWETADGAQTDEGTEIIWVAFGNPTRSTGRFRECFRRFRSLWSTRSIDSRAVEGTNKTYLDELITTHGEDSDFAKVRVRGVFPAQSLMQFISEDDVELAQKRHLRANQYDFAPKILSVDPAWTGDDELVIGMRQGLWFQVLATMARNDNDIAVAQVIADLEDKHEADAVFIDGGYGTGIASAGKTWKRKWQLVWFGSPLPMESGVINLRARMWRDMKQWIKDGGVLPRDSVLAQDLTGVEALPRTDGRLQLESKQDMKERGLPSPNRADALAITFAYPVMPKGDAARDTTNFTKGITDRRPA